jgi:hypothetical protein
MKIGRKRTFAKHSEIEDAHNKLKFLFESLNTLRDSVARLQSEMSILFFIHKKNELKDIEAVLTEMQEEASTAIEDATIDDTIKEIKFETNEVSDSIETTIN